MRRARLSIAAWVTASFCLVAQANAQTCTDHGVPVSGFPNWQERAMLVVTNACRMAPQQFRNAYLPTVPQILQPTLYPAVAPLQWRYELNETARAHSIDLGNTSGCPFQHNSCDGTPWGNRIFAHYSGTIGENIAAGFYNPLTTVIGLLADPYLGAPAPDFSGYDGHRRNIMYAGYTELGTGYATGPNQYLRYWTQDFGHPATLPAVCSLIAAGSHIFDPETAVNFLANYYDPDNRTPQSALVIVDGSAFQMTAYLGSRGQGTYRYTLAAGTTCRAYHFEFRDSAGTMWRYPTHGDLLTFGEGDCSADFTDSGNPPPTPTPTPRPSPTPLPSPSPRPSPSPAPRPTPSPIPTPEAINATGSVTPQSAAVGPSSQNSDTVGTLGGCSAGGSSGNPVSEMVVLLMPGLFCLGLRQLLIR